jgi:hypothetical protein
MSDLPAHPATGLAAVRAAEVDGRLAVPGASGAEGVRAFYLEPRQHLQLRGSALPLWLDVLPPIPADIWCADLGRIASALWP